MFFGKTFDPSGAHLGPKVLWDPSGRSFRCFNEAISSHGLWTFFASERAQPMVGPDHCAHRSLGPHLAALCVASGPQIRWNCAPKRNVRSLLVSFGQFTAPVFVGVLSSVRYAFFRFAPDVVASFHSAWWVLKRAKHHGERVPASEPIVFFGGVLSLELIWKWEKNTC